MTWVRIEENWHGHPKMLGAGLAAMGLYTWGLSYSSHYLTDGFIPKNALPGLVGTKPAAKALEVFGVWEPVPGGWRIHDYLDYNPSKAQVEAQRAADKERKQAERKAGTEATTHDAHGRFTARRPANVRPDKPRTAAGVREESARSHPLPGPGTSPEKKYQGSVGTLVGSGDSPVAIDSFRARLTNELTNQMKKFQTETET